MKIFHKGPFLANTDTHVQYMLPDNIHMVDIYLWRNSVSCAVMRKSDYSTRESMRVSFDKCPTWNDITWGFEELAAKKYARDMFQLPRRGK